MTRSLARARAGPDRVARDARRPARLARRNRLRPGDHRAPTVRTRSRSRRRCGPRGDRVVLALARSRGSLARLREDPRVALTRARRAGPRVHRPRVGRRRRRPAARRGGRRRRSRSRSRRSAATSARRSRSRRAWRGAGPTRRRSSATAPCARRCSPSRAHRLCCVKLATFLPPGGGTPLAGEVRGDRVVGFGDGVTVLDRLRSGDRTPAGGDAHALADVTLLAPHIPRAIFGIGLNYRAHAAEQGKEPPETPIVFMKLPTSAAPPERARPPAGRRAPPGLRGRARRRHGPGRHGRRVRRRRRRQRPRPAAPRAAVDAREGRRRLLPVRPVGHDGRRGRRSGGPRRCARGSTASCARTRRRAISSSRSRS